MWLIDHQMNLKLSEEFGQYFIRLPLKKSAKIVNANALRIDWTEVIKPEDCSCILGNPPFVGSAYQDDEQKEDMVRIGSDIKEIRVLDYVCAWYIKSAVYIKGCDIRCSFVSTSSITQGEQVGVLWAFMTKKHFKIFFAHRTFAWSSEARGKAAVHCVIIGFSNKDIHPKYIYDYEESESSASRILATSINPYLIDGPTVLLLARTKPISIDAPRMTRGSQPTDGGNLILSDDERSILIERDPLTAKYIQRFFMGDDFISGNHRYCLWLKNCTPSDLKKMPDVLNRVEAVRKSRLASKKPATQTWAQKPALFQEDRQPNCDYLAIPQVSSKRRSIIPIGMMASSDIAGNKLSIITGVTIYHFGIITSCMHMA